jgi:hypothetical protein
MKFDVNVISRPDESLHKVLSIMLSNLGEIVKTSSQLVADLHAVLERQHKTAVEIAIVQDSVNRLTAKVAELQAIVGKGGFDSMITQELIDAVEAVKSQAETIDEQIPDLVEPIDPVR